VRCPALATTWAPPVSTVSAHARQRGPVERANVSLKSWKVLRRIRCCPLRATSLVKAVLVLILAG
jgi:hypothetical protein